MGSDSKSFSRIIRLLLLLFAVANSALAVDKEYIGTENDWSNDDNWTPSGLPGPDDEVMIGNGSVVTISEDVGDVHIFRIGGDIQLDEEGNPILRQDDEGPQGDKRLVTPSEGTLNIVEGGILEVNQRGYAGGGGLVGGIPTLVGVGPSLGVINMSGGELVFSGVDPVVFLASDLENVGVLNMSGGRIETGNFWLSRAGHGMINQTGGSLTVTRWFIIDEACLACGAAEIGDTSGTYNMSGGELNVEERFLVGRLGQPSSAVMNLMGGVVTVDTLVFPTNSESDQFNMSKVGVLRVTGQILDDSGDINAETAIEFGRINGLNLQVEDDDGVMVVRNPGDPNANGVADATDIDALSAVVNTGANDLSFDLTDDDLVNEDDRTAWVTNVAMTFFGDADINGSVAFNDFVTLSNNFNGEGGWTDGNFDGKDTIGFNDFVILSNNFGQTTIRDISVVPEPSRLLCVGALGVLGWTRRRRQALSLFV